MHYCKSVCLMIFTRIDFPNIVGTVFLILLWCAAAGGGVG